MGSRAFREEHPWLMCLAIVLGLSVVVAYWYVWLALAAAFLAGWGLWRYTLSYDQRHLERTRQRQTLRAHADYENHLWTMGDARGFYGQFPPRLR